MYSCSVINQKLCAKEINLALYHWLLGSHSDKRAILEGSYSYAACAILMQNP